MPGAGSGGANHVREKSPTGLFSGGGPLNKDRLPFELYYCAYKSDAPDCCGDVMSYHETASWVLGFSATYKTLVQEVSRLLCQHFKIKEASNFDEQRWPNGQADMQLSGSMWVDWENGKSSRITPRTFQEVMIALRAKPDLAIKARCTLMQDGRAEDDIMQANKSVTRWKRAEMQRVAAQRKEEANAGQAEEHRRQVSLAEMQRKEAESKRKQEQAAKPSGGVRAKKSFASLKKKASRIASKGNELWLNI